ncbi:MAG: LacI family DNA-binding transcriptional regulator [Candidatus Kariarchaeaceae archaeon]|jgi:LacI family transcriptional regulator
MKKGKTVRQNKPRLKDVANEAGVSAQTVSNYLNRKVNIRNSTRKRIEQALQDFNYVPNIFARGLRGSKTNTVGVIIPEIANPFFATVVEGIEEVTSSRGYTIVLASSNYENTKLKTELHKLSYFVDGIILCTNMIDDESIKSILKKSIPIVALDIKVENGLIPSIAPNHYRVIYSGVEYLINMGHKNIYFLSEPETLGGIFKDRISGYKDCLKDNGILLDEKKIITDERLEIRKTLVGYEIMNEIINIIEIPAAVYAASDLIVIGAMKATVDRKVEVPDEISFLGCDNIYLSEYTNPPLSTIDMNEREMGKKGMEVLIELLSRKKIKEKQIFLNSELIERSTVKNLAV